MKTIKTKTVDGLSFSLLFISFIANIIAFWYAWLIEQPPLLFKYSLALVCLTVCITLYLQVYFRRPTANREKSLL